MLGGRDHINILLGFRMWVDTLIDPCRNDDDENVQEEN